MYGDLCIIAAISTDSISWTEKPIAAFIHKKGYIFFAAVNDVKHSRFGSLKNPPMVSTYHDMKRRKAGN
jgi:levanase/fructan beta-fructosidase